MVSKSIPDIIFRPVWDEMRAPPCPFYPNSIPPGLEPYPKPDISLRDYERITLGNDIDRPAKYD
ncbi:MAG: hypothetical protein PHF97_11325 [Bacteroidales bacterium]|nr:hypothetical protein [Bacteroidales bacterium]